MVEMSNNTGAEPVIKVLLYIFFFTTEILDVTDINHQ